MSDKTATHAPPAVGRGSVSTGRVRNALRGVLNLQQWRYLRKPLNTARVLKREGKYSYLAAWDVRAHLIRIFGFGNFDVELVEDKPMGIYDYVTVYNRGKANEEHVPMVEVVWKATVRLVVRDEMGYEIARYSEGAVGAATGRQAQANRGDLMDNALKTAASDAFKRCCINLGTQFGLSLYNDGATHDIVKTNVVGPDGFDDVGQMTPEQKQAYEQLAASLGGANLPTEDAAVGTDPDARGGSVGDGPGDGTGQGQDESPEGQTGDYS